MNLSTSGAGSRTVEAFVSQIDEEADPAGHWFRARATSLGGRDHEEASVNQMGHRRSAVRTAAFRLSFRTPTRRATPQRRANRARYPEPVSVLIHIV